MDNHGGMIGGKVVEHNLYRKKLETKTFDYFDGKAGHIALLERARANSEASCGLYANSEEGVSNESLFVSDYKY